MPSHQPEGRSKASLGLPAPAPAPVPVQNHLSITTFFSVKKSIASLPWPCRSPKKESLLPEKGKKAMAATTPILTPMLPACTLYLNSRADLPLEVKMEDALPCGLA